jgi:hypothetical protein
MMTGLFRSMSPMKPFRRLDYLHMAWNSASYEVPLYMTHSTQIFLPVVAQVTQWASGSAAQYVHYSKNNFKRQDFKAVNPATGHGVHRQRVYL